MTYQEARKKMDEALKAARELCKGAFDEGAAALFEANPGLTSFGWRQYTPYFNDGDECRFSAHVDEPDVNGVGGYEVDSGEDWDRTALKMVRNRQPSLEYTLQGPVADFLGRFAADDPKAIFGDHVKVTVTRRPDGTVETDVTDYDHD